MILVNNLENISLISSDNFLSSGTGVNVSWLNTKMPAKSILAGLSVFYKNTNYFTPIRALSFILEVYGTFGRIAAGM